MITSRVVDEAILWNTKHQKPVLMSEYGADTVEGLHFVSKRARFENKCSLTDNVPLQLTHISITFIG